MFVFNIYKFIKIFNNKCFFSHVYNEHTATNLIQHQYCGNLISFKPDKKKKILGIILLRILAVLECYSKCLYLIRIDNFNFFNNKCLFPPVYKVHTSTNLIQY